MGKREISESDSKLLGMLHSAALTPEELKVILNQPKPDPKHIRIYDHSDGRRFNFGIISDSHIGHKKFDEGLLALASKVFAREGVKTVYHVGDICEGMSGRPGHVYELAKIGFSQQVGEAERLFNQHLSRFRIFGITGNHDDWFKLKNDAGANVGEELERRVEHFTYLGENEARIKLGPRTDLMIFHPGDGTAYATSYKLQKLVESFTGGEKPSILAEGHYHKAMYSFMRGVHALESGTLCGQTGWMRGKKIPAHKGFWRISGTIGKQGINSFSPTFYPAYD